MIRSSMGKLLFLSAFIIQVSTLAAQASTDLDYSLFPWEFTSYDTVTFSKSYDRVLLQGRNVSMDTTQYVLKNAATGSIIAKGETEKSLGVNISFYGDLAVKQEGPMDINRYFFQSSMITDFVTGQKLATIAGDHEFISHVAKAGDVTKVFTTQDFASGLNGPKKNDELYVYSSRTNGGEPSKEILPLEGTMNDGYGNSVVKITKDGKYLAYSSIEAVVLMDLESKKTIARVMNESADGLPGIGMSDDEKLI